MKLQFTTISACMILATACAPIDNDDAAPFASKDAKLAAQTRVETPSDVYRTPANANLHAAIDVDMVDGQVPTQIAPGLAPTSEQIDSETIDTDAAQASERFVDLDGNGGELTTDPDFIEEPEVQHLGAGECLALGFGGDTSGRIINSKTLNLDFSKGATIEGWIRIDGENGVILSKKSGVQDAFWSLGYNAGQLIFTVASDASHQSVYAAEFPAGEWFHFSIVRGDLVEGGAEIYIDGVNGTEQLENGADNIDVINPYPVVIGMGVNGEATNFKGALLSLHMATDIWHSNDFVAESELEAVETTMGLWDFTDISNGMVGNTESDDYPIRLRGPIYTEHSTICD